MKRKETDKTQSVEAIAERDKPGDVAVSGLENVRNLGPSEQAFVDLLCSPPWPGVGDAGVEAGYSRDYSYILHAKPHIKAAISERMAQVAEDNRRKAQRVLDRFEKRSERNDSVGNEAGKIFLEASGLVGKAAQINVTTTQVNTGEGEPLSDRIGRIRSERFEPSKS